MFVTIKCTSSIFIFPNFRCLVTSNEKCTLGKLRFEAPCTFLRFLNPHIIHLFEIFAVADYMLFREIILKKTCFSP